MELQFQFWEPFHLNRMNPRFDLRRLRPSLFNDGLHPTGAEYARMWKVLAPQLAEDLT
jgi:hypothetical protein